MNQELEISCRALGNPLPGIQWLNEDNKIVSNSSILHFKEIHITDSGRYVCKASLGKLVKETTVKIIVNCKLLKLKEKQKSSSIAKKTRKVVK